MLTNTHEQREAIEVVLQACENLSEVRIGGLIAIERSIQLEEAVESGIVVDCEATPEMIETIFFPNNAVHDGGLILKGDRITHAACIFPLTDRKDLAKTMGTRHRAAIGLSEETDAIVVVVSEETGNISYAHKGQLVRRVTIEALREFLSGELVPPTKSRNWWDLTGRWRKERPQPPAVLLSEDAETKTPSASS
jgi:diadenylate cyclase